MGTQSREVQHFQVERLKVEIHPTREAAAVAAAGAAAEALKKLKGVRETIGVIFATGASQLDTLKNLIETPSLPWNQVRGFHMDEYVGLDADHPASFCHYLREKLTQKVQMEKFFEIDGTAPDLEQACRDYASQLRCADPQLCLLGIGENGHLAFNDPAVANFNDPMDMKVVELDGVCRQQQVAEGWFESTREVPERAMTLTIPALFRVPKLIVSVPGPRKAEIVRRTLEEPITIGCPATILRTHPDATIYLDRESSAKVRGCEHFAAETGGI
ncbi:MAG: glucosamine-6-phosphate deaminase [Acidobacteriaceae bacterium]